MAMLDTMTETTQPKPATSGSLLARLEALTVRLAPQSLTSLVLRVAVALPFWRSGANKWDAFAGLDLAANPWESGLAESGFFRLSEITTLLFTSEFKLHLFGATLDYPFPFLTGWLAGMGEIILPLLLILGLFTRFAAVGILAMTLIIQLTIPGAWSLHLTWAAMALAILAMGPGRFSLDALLRRS